MFSPPTRFVKCNVTIKMVLDGAYDPSAVKKATVLQRLKDQARNAVNITPSCDPKGTMLFPIFGRGA